MVPIKFVDVIGDTGCSGVIVKQQHVSDDQYTGRVGLMQMVDNSVIRVPIANEHINSPYLPGQVQAVCPQGAVYDLIVGNVPERDRPMTLICSEWRQKAAVTKAARRKKIEGAPALCPSPEKQWISVNREEIVRMRVEGTILYEGQET